MATIRAYTTVEQSKKLAEILPLESADMEYMFLKKDINKVSNIPFVKDDNEPEWPGDSFYDSITCWSLAALLEAIPQEIFDGEYIINITEGLNNKWILTYDHYKNRNNSYYSLSIGADNLVDACYEMIIRLNELKML